MSTGFRPLKLFYAQSKSGEINFGDELSPLLLSYATNRTVVASRFEDCDIVGLGSILHKIASTRNQYRLALNQLVLRKNRPVVWGSGFISPTKPIKTNLLETRIVRGRLTSKIMGDPTTLFGDPGLLIGDYFQERKKKYKLGIVPHYVDMSHPKIGELSGHDDIKIISVRSDPIAVLRQISQCHFIASSSLHGLMAADCFGIPNCRIKLTDRLAGGDFKFLDYASSVERRDVTAHELDADIAENIIAHTDNGHHQNIEEKVKLLKSCVLDFAY